VFQKSKANKKMSFEEEEQKQPRQNSVEPISESSSKDTNQENEDGSLESILKLIQDAKDLEQTLDPSNGNDRSREVTINSNSSSNVNGISCEGTKLAISMTALGTAMKDVMESGDDSGDSGMITTAATAASKSAELCSEILVFSPVLGVAFSALNVTLSRMNTAKEVKEENIPKTLKYITEFCDRLATLLQTLQKESILEDEARENVRALFTIAKDGMNVVSKVAKKQRNQLYVMRVLHAQQYQQDLNDWMSTAEKCLRDEVHLKTTITYYRTAKMMKVQNFFVPTQLALSSIQGCIGLVSLYMIHSIYRNVTADHFVVSWAKQLTVAASKQMPRLKDEIKSTIVDTRRRPSLFYGY